MAKVFLNPTRTFASFSTPGGSLKEVGASVLCHSPTAPAGVLANSGIAQAGAFSVDADASSSSSQTDSEIIMSQHQQELVLKLKVRVSHHFFSRL